MRRIKYYNNRDLSVGFYKNQIEDVIASIETKLVIGNINDAIEIYNIGEFIKNDIIFKNWDHAFIKRYHEALPMIKKALGQYCAGIDDNKILLLAKDVEFNYHGDFIKMLSKYGTFKHISDSIFKKILLEKNIYLVYVLREKSIVDEFPDTIVEVLLADAENATIIIDKYEVEKEHPIYLPSSFDEVKKEELLSKYIDTDRPHADYIKIISTSNNMNLSSRLKFKAKKKYDELMETLFENGDGFPYGASVKFAKNQKEEVLIGGGGHSIDYSFSEDWILQNFDNPTLLNNFIYLFGYVDSFFRIASVGNDSDYGTLEKHLGIKGKHYYNSSIGFQIKNAATDIIMLAYSEFLKKNNTSIEEVIGWFFSDYLINEFDINIDFEIPTDDITYREKCVLMLPQLDRFIQQIQQLSVDGKIDKEFLYFDTESLSLSSIKSRIENKYILKSEKFNSALCFFFFSDQSLGMYFEDHEYKEECLFDILINQNITIDDVPNHNLDDFNYFIKEGVLLLKDKQIQFVEPKRLWVYKELYTNDCLSTDHLPESFSDIMSDLISSNEVKYDDSFLSNVEQDYFNYYLNKQEFTNGLNLRNKYLHNAKIDKDDSEDTQKQHYVIILKLIILLIIKLNDELCILAK